jgi:hypothetical protein
MPAPAVQHHGDGTAEKSATGDDNLAIGGRHEERKIGKAESREDFFNRRWTWIDADERRDQTGASEGGELVR